MSKHRANQALRHEIALRFGEAMLERRLSVSKAARQLKVTRQALSQYLAEKCMPGGKVLERACRVWNLSLNVNGFSFTKEAFGVPKKKQPKAEQLNLYRALSEISPEQIDTKLVRSAPNMFEFRVRIKIAS